MNEDLFGKGWRDPTDDAQRAKGYLSAALGALMGLFSAYTGLVALFTGRVIGGGTDPTNAKVYGWLCFPAGLTIGSACIWFLAKESRYWNLRKMTAERFVAGLFMLGVGMVLLGIQTIGSNTKSEAGSVGSLFAMFGLAAVGGVVLVFTLLLGLFIAFVVPAIRMRKQILTGVKVTRRFAVDDNLMEIEDYPSPESEGWRGYVQLDFKGRMLILGCDPTAYEFAEVGCRGVATVAGDRLRMFRATVR